MNADASSDATKRSPRPVFLHSQRGGMPYAASAACRMHLSGLLQQFLERGLELFDAIVLQGVADGLHVDSQACEFR
jgi:hypothetical protein